MPPKKSVKTAKKNNGIPKQSVPLPTNFESKGDRKVRTAIENRVIKRNKLLRDVFAPKEFELEDDEIEDIDLDDESMPAFPDDLSDQSQPDHSEKEIDDLMNDVNFDEQDDKENEEQNQDEEEEDLDLTCTTKEFTLPSELQSQIQSLSEHLDQPHDFIGASSSLQKQLQTICKQFYDYSKSIELSSMKTSPLAELVVEGFDYEQIWEELQLQNVPALKWLDRKMKELEKSNIDFNVSDLEENEDEDENDEDQDEDQLEEGNEELDEDELDEEAEEDEDAGVTGDRFFDPDEMEQFLDEAEEDEENENQDEKDLDDLDEEDLEGVDTEDAKYSDFFTNKPAKRRANRDEFDVDVLEDLDDEQDEEADEEDDAEYLNTKTDENGQTLPQLKERLEKLEANKDPNNMSSYEKKIAKIQEQINNLEDLIVAEKPWVLKGEVSGKYRPKDSLLNVALDFEQGSKPAPIVTEEVTSNIEEMIKRRIKDSSYDDVIRKKQDEKKVKKVVELDQTKSKVGLAEVYEKEFMKEAYGIDEEKDKLTEEHKTVLNLFKRVNYHLDRLANFYYTPKPDLEVQKKSNVAAIQMEEALPTLVSESSTLAPEEVYGKPKELKGDAEMTSDDKKRKRKGVKEAKKKQKIAKEAAEKVKKRENPNMKTSRAKAEEKLMKERDRNTIIAKNSSSGPTSSTELFKQLQSEIRGDISKQKKQKPQEKSDTGKKVSSFKL